MWEIAYLINLPSRIDRLENSLKELSKVGIDPVVVPGIIGTSGVMGCKQAHLNVMSMALSNDETPLIIEDDISFSDSYTEVAPKLLGELQHLEWDLFFFYCDNKHAHQYSDALMFGPTNCTHFYLVNKKSLKKVIDIVYASHVHAIDADFIHSSDRGELNIFCSSQNLVYQNIELPSSILNGHYMDGDFNGIFRKV